MLQAQLPRFRTDVQLFVFEQRRRQPAEFSIVLDDQDGSTLLCLPHR
jgi:hypothetical protein